MSEFQPTSAPFKPHYVEYICEECGKETAVNLRTGTVNGHHRPGTHNQCDESGRFIVEPDGSFDNQPRPPRAVPVEVTECAECGQFVGHDRDHKRTCSVVATVDVRPSTRSTSVRVVRGGLPTLGKRH